MPLRGLFVGVGRPKNRLFIEGPTCELQANGKAFGKAAGDADRRKPIDIERPCILGEKGNHLHALVSDCHLVRTDLKRHDGDGWACKKVHLLHQLKALLKEEGTGPLRLDDSQRRR